MINLSGKCGSCAHFEKHLSTTNGYCKIDKYGDDVAHDPQNPYRFVPRSKVKCRHYVQREVQDG